MPVKLSSLARWEMMELLRYSERPAKQADTHDDPILATVLPARRTPAPGPLHLQPGQASFRALRKNRFFLSAFLPAGKRQRTDDRSRLFLLWEWTGFHHFSSGTDDGTIG